jgi:hypothetical protein
MKVVGCIRLYRQPLAGAGRAARIALAAFLQFLCLQLQIHQTSKNIRGLLGSLLSIAVFLFAAASFLVTHLKSSAFGARSLWPPTIARSSPCLAMCLVLHGTVWYAFALGVPARKRLTAELMLLGSLVLLFCWSWFLLWATECNCTCRKLCRALLAVLITSVALVHFSTLSTDSLPHPFYVSSLGRSTDFCALEGLRISPLLASAVAWQGLLPRRLFNFFTGDESCGERRFSWYDSASNTVAVAEVCFSTRQPPIVVVADPSKNDLGNMDLLDSDAAGELGATAAEWERVLEERYGRSGASNQFDVIRGASDGRQRIRRVTLRLTDAMKVVRETRYPRSPQSLGPVVYSVPVVSTAMSVFCGAVEEYHVHPIDLPSSVESKEAKYVPPASVLVLVLDAVSTLELSRSMPRTQDWIRTMQSDLRRSHVVGEALGATTIGHSTNFNLGPALTGAARMWLRADDGTREGNIFDRLKEQYSSGVAVSFLSGACGNTQYFNLGAPNGRTDGFTTSTLDREVFGPMCHSDFSSQSGNFVGAYSIVKRCIGQRHVHQHLLELIGQALEQDRRANRSFFQLGYFLEGHEGTHGVLHLLDGDLAAFLGSLETSGFFRDERSALLLMSDHGNHMGPYYELSLAGKVERTQPFSVWFVPKAVLKARDSRRGLSAGTSEEFLNARLRRVSTHFDTYLTLADLMDLKNASVHCDRTMPWCNARRSASLFDASPQPLGAVRECADVNAEPLCALKHCV